MLIVQKVVFYFAKIKIIITHVWVLHGLPQNYMRQSIVYTCTCERAVDFQAALTFALSFLTAFTSNTVNN